METIIPILIAIVIFAFQAYSNFQKEQEKAQKRNLGQPPLPEDNADRPAPFPEQQPTAPVQRGFEAYSGVMDAKEMTHTYKGGQHTVIPTRLAMSEETHAQTTFDTTEFDLRDAVIKSVILERPYQ